MENKILTALFVFVSFLVTAQKIQPKEQLILSDSLAFFGIDFSLAKMVNPEKIGQDVELRNTHGVYWDRIDDAFVANNNLKFEFQKKQVYTNVSFFDSSCYLLQPGWVVDRAGLLNDSLVGERIKPIKWATSSKLGLVFFVEKMDKPSGQLYVCAAYFNTVTGELIRTIHFSGKGKGIGYTNFWANAFQDAYNQLQPLNDNYRGQLKRYFKKNELR